MSRVLVTSALPYANGRIHIGHLAGAYLPADIYVRYLRMKGAEVVYVCGSDEHGVPITIAAEKEGVGPQEIVNRFHCANARAFEEARISFDIYDRTTNMRHHELSQKYFARLLENGHIEKKETEQLHCPNCRRFLPDRYVEGICPHCRAPGARGDQCDRCGRVVDPLKLGEPNCQICGARPEVRKTTHWFLKLGDFSERLREWIESHTEWRDNVRLFSLNWIKEGLRSRAITRDLDWGVPVPLDEARGKVIYVWFDAPIGYVSFTQEWAEWQNEPEKWRDYWQSDESEVIHFIGKDNIPFHAISWPAMIMGVNDGTRIPSNIVASEYLTFATGDKLSKSRGKVLEVLDFVEAFGPDYLRYYLTANAPEARDTAFSWDDLRRRVNNELNDVLGNFVHRTLSFVRRYLQARVPEAKARDSDRRALRAIGETAGEVGKELEGFRFRSALSKVIAVARLGNRFFEERQPWATRKSSPEECAAAMNTCVQLVRGLSDLLEPFLPDASNRLRVYLGKAASETPVSWDSIGRDEAPAGAALGKPRVLFRKLEDADVAKLQAAGS